MNYIDRYIELFELRKTKFKLFDGKLFYVYNKMILPYGPVSLNYSINESDIKKLFNELNDGVLVRYTDGFQQTNNSWYSIIAKEHQSIENVNSKLRNEINKGLNNFVVKQIDSDFIIKNGFDVEVAAYSRYKNTSTTDFTPTTFKEFHTNSVKFNDIINYWGVFKNDRLIAYATVYLFSKIEANIARIKLHPDYVKQHSSYALMYNLSEYYLEKNKLECLNDGFKSIYHESNIQDFLIKKFNFMQQPTNLYVHFKPPYNYFMKYAKPFSGVLSKFDKRFEPLFKLNALKING